ncbi:deaminase domain-containing protein [Thermomonospora umbrina]|uniref:Putative deaminase of polymorphic toxin system n=1 Tax=Thermomonospora umbrina TaxID=111806 RepID=A0A3D9SMH0_9ACTN|nr:deaminase domain-containing protein [Thermomonospora umbrina]REE97119.1 putative deaminase of polymorphic toxin system [Thermomonospora umbrina]
MDNVVTAEYKAGGRRGAFDAVTGLDAGDDPALVGVPSEPVFTPSAIGEAVPTETHGEYKVLEAFAEQVPTRRVKGWLRMYSEQYPCSSCRNVMQQFLRAYPRMTIELAYTHGEPADFTPDPVNPRIEISHIDR